MDAIIIFIMLVFSGLFTGGVLTIAWNRLPAWKSMNAEAFKTDFRRTIKVADRLQPILLAGTILTAVIFNLSESGIERMLILIAISGFIVVLLASVAVLVPLQKHILNTDEPFTRAYTKWQQGHMGRTALSLLSFFLLVASLSIQASN